MRLTALKTALLATLLILPAASRVQAGGGPDPDANVKKKKKIVVQVPEKDVLIEGDFDEPEMLADLRELENLPDFSFFQGGGYIGVRPVEMTPELRAHFGAPKEAGVFVGSVEKDSPAAKAGLQVADIVTSADGEKVASRRDLVRAVRHKKDGETVQLELVRDRAVKTLSVTVAERPDKEIRLGELGPGKRKFRWRDGRFLPPAPPGAPAAPLTPDLQERLDDLEKRLDALESRVPQKQSF